VLCNVRDLLVLTTLRLLLMLLVVNVSERFDVVIIFARVFRIHCNKFRLMKTE
jgi:hypothetical protein